MGVYTLVRKFGKICSVVGIVGLASVVSFFIVRDAFRITHIEVIGDNIALEIDKNRLPQNLLFFPIEKISMQLREENSLIGTIRMRKKYPHTLIIEITRRTPLAILHTGNQEVALSGDGVVVGDRTNDVTHLYFDTGTFGIGQTVKDRRVQQSLLFIDYLPNMLVASVANFDRLSLRAKIGKTDILFPQDGDIASVAATLQTLFYGFRIKGTLPAIIDLRFDKPIVTF